MSVRSAFIARLLSASLGAGLLLGGCNVQIGPPPGSTSGTGGSGSPAGVGGSAAGGSGAGTGVGASGEPAPERTPEPVRPPVPARRQALREAAAR